MIPLFLNWRKVDVVKAEDGPDKDLVNICIIPPEVNIPFCIFSLFLPVCFRNNTMVIFFCQSRLVLFHSGRPLFFCSVRCCQENFALNEETILKEELYLITPTILKPKRYPKIPVPNIFYVSIYKQFLQFSPYFMLRECINRLELIDYLIRIKGTGTPKQLAARLNISDRSVFEYLNLMKDLGAPIKYSREKQSYYYEEDGLLQLKFKKVSY